MTIAGDWDVKQQNKQTNKNMIFPVNNRIATQCHDTNYHHHSIHILQSFALSTQIMFN